ncbi:MAG TPA: bifunctional diaminohydroxyphosphoribosylaminopyrimidine deaminase/5-amino-6-(5-phosphoribosylamino)uracil reductase RibD [Candidatus Peribacteraceae bacterium]|nr:bifunctional diaminohydroxyphosphoribosylaminopyrimidine deaminase/5-amino-6-(5-phosphoribosylamino)uracil reductase RibD [Candidatus Peribacteraceae bacterium]
MTHADFMHRCLELAMLGHKRVGNGALVGSVLVRDGKIIAEDFHREFGREHAERALLQSFTGDILPTDTLYVNLEPCCHHGKTLPCTDIILERGVKHVVIGMQDPDSRVRGQGIELLRSKGVMIEGPVLRAECEWLNRGFLSVRTKNRPWITLKSAHASDGRIANADGSPLAITSQEQNVWSHTFLRSRHDAILVGVQTIINDNPRLDARLAPLTPGPSPEGRGEFFPWRIIFDPHGRTPHDAHVVTDEHASSTIIIVDPSHAEKLSDQSQNGVKIFPIAIAADGFVWNDLWNVLLQSSGDFHGVTSILVEGGAKTWEMFKKAGMMDMEVNVVGSGQ